VALFPEFTPKAWDSPYSDFARIYENMYIPVIKGKTETILLVCVCGGRYLATVGLILVNRPSCKSLSKEGDFF